MEVKKRPVSSGALRQLKNRVIKEKSYTPEIKSDEPEEPSSKAEVITGTWQGSEFELEVNFKSFFTLDNVGLVKEIQKVVRTENAAKETDLARRVLPSLLVSGSLKDKDGQVTPITKTNLGELPDHLVRTLFNEVNKKFPR
jgi:hypothetical protein